MTRAKFGGILAALIVVVILTMAFNIGMAAAAPTTVTAYKSTIAVNVKSQYQASQWTDTQTFNEPNSGMTFAVKYNSTGWLFLMQWKQSSTVCTDQYCFGGIELGSLTNTQPMGSTTTPTIMILASTSFTGGVDEFISTGELTPTSVQSSGYSVQTICGTTLSGTQYTAVCYRPFKLTNASPYDFPTLGVGSTIEIGFALGEFNNPGDHYASDMSTYVLTLSASTYTSTTSSTSSTPISTSSSTSSTSISTSSTTSTTSKTSSSSTSSTTSSTQSTTSSASTSSTSPVTFTVTTNSRGYSGSQTGTISGTETGVASATGTVDIMINNPAGNDVFSNAVAIQSNGSFNDTFYTGVGNLWATGTYTITAYWSIYTTSSTFAYTVTTSSSTSSSGSTTVTTTSTQTTTSTTTKTVTGPITTSTVTGPTTTVTGPTSTATQTTTSTVTQTTSSIPDWAYGVMVFLLLAGLAIGYVVKRPTTRQG